MSRYEHPDYSIEDYVPPSRKRRFAFGRADEAVPPRILLKSMLLQDEHVLEVGQISLGIYWKSVAMLLFSSVFILSVAALGLPLPLLTLVTVFLVLKVITMFVIAYLTSYYLLLVVTNKRVIVRYGILNLEVFQLNYSKIESSEVASTIPGRIFGYSTVFVSGTGGNMFAVPYIVNAMRIRKMITEILIRRDDTDIPTPLPVDTLAEEDIVREPSAYVPA